MKLSYEEAQEIQAAILSDDPEVKEQTRQKFMAEKLNATEARTMAGLDAFNRTLIALVGKQMRIYEEAFKRGELDPLVTLALIITTRDLLGQQARNIERAVLAFEQNLETNQAARAEEKPEAP